MAVFTRTEANNPGSGLWFEVIQFVLQGVPTPTSFTLLNADGTLTEVVGTGFDFDLVNGVPLGGTIQSMSQVPGTGGAAIRTLTGLNHSLVGAYNASPALGEFFLNGDDTMFGNSRDNNLFGFGGNDIINGRAGVDFIDGGEGFDIASYGGATAGVVVDLAAQHSWDGTSMDFFVSIEGATGSNFTDHLFGSAGDNVFNGLGGVDAIDGAGGTDTVSYRTGFTSGVYVDLASQIAWDGTSMDFFVSIESAIGSDFSDILFGSAGNNVFNGLGGVDVINGGGGSDTVSYRVGFTSGVTVDLSAQNAWDGTSMDFLTSIENVVGTNQTDILQGSSGDNEFEGLEGVDVINGLGGSDTLRFTNHGSAVSIDLANQWTWDGTSMDFLTSIENTSGSAFDDTIVGSTGNNIIGGFLGDDILTGNGGNDTFQYRDLRRGNDTISDFDSNPVDGQDVIDIVGRGLTAASIGSDILIEALAADVTLITFASDGTTIRLLGVNSTTIDGGDFLF